MIYEEDKIGDITIAYIGGGSKGWAWDLMGDLALEDTMSGKIKLYDIDYEAAKKNEVIGNRVTDQEGAKGKWKYKAVKKLEEALSGADFVIISILPGTLDEMYSDVHTPEKYGIYQLVGDTVGPGGIVRGLRTIPMMAEMAAEIKKYCPNAWVINYTNPMTLCTRALYEVFPEINAFGCCHEVFSAQSQLVKALEEIEDIKNVERHEIKVNVLGINHFTWIDKAFYKGMDLFPVYAAYAEKHKDGIPNLNVFTNSVIKGQKLRFELFRKYGMIAAAGDRHLPEFFPAGFFLENLETIKKWNLFITPVDWRRKNYAEKDEKSRKLFSGEDKVEIKRSCEEGIQQMKGILGLGDWVTNVNLPNKGQIKEVPEGAVVETNAAFRSQMVTPLVSGKLPDEIHNLIIRHIYNQEIIIKAAFKKDKELAFKAFANDPLVTIGMDKARELFNIMLENTKNYLPGWKI